MAGQVIDGNQDQDQGGNDLGWRAGLPDEFKENDWAKTHGKVGDFFKDALQVKTDHDSMKTKMEGAIFKPGENSTPEDRAAFHKALGVPEKSSDYDFTAADGVLHDPKMIEWAQGTFHKANLSKEQAGVISQAWDGFMTEMEKANTEAQAAAKADTDTKLKTDWGSDYDKNRELASRAFAHFFEKDEAFKAFLDETEVGDPPVKLGNHPVFLKGFHAIGLAMGEDFSLKGTGTGTNKLVPGMVYDMPDFA